MVAGGIIAHFIWSMQSTVMVNFSCSKTLALFAVIFLAVAGAQSQKIETNWNRTWVGAWAASQQIPEPRNTVPLDSLQNATLRQVIHLSVGGEMIRLRVSNAFGTEPLHLLAVHVARPVSPATSQIEPETDKAVTFNGNPDVLVPVGAEYFSDPLKYPVKPLSNLTITMQIEAAPGQETSHPGSRATSYLAQGVPVTVAEMPKATTIEHWYFLSGLDVTAPANAAAVVALGDSITDGHGATTNGNNRWTDDLAQRIQDAKLGHEVSVLNEGTGGNRLLEYGLGPDALARFNRDVLSQTGARYLIVLEGVNDLGMLTHDRTATEAEHNDLTHRIIGSFRQIITRAHARGIKVIGGTIMPFVGSAYYHPGALTEADRQAINTWIRAKGHFDAVVDFDRVIRDPAHPDRLRPDYDSGDHLHPSVVGYNAMAKAIPLALFQD